MSQSLSSRAMSFDNNFLKDLAEEELSQSLSSRAMSFDTTLSPNDWPLRSLNPFRAGRCLSTIRILRKLKRKLCLNPFRAGRCLSTKKMKKFKTFNGLNPFRAGRCLSTAAVCWRQESCGLSDPLPNFFGRLRSWLLIWANNEQIACFFPF